MAPRSGFGNATPAQTKGAAVCEPQSYPAGLTFWMSTSVHLPSRAAGCPPSCCACFAARQKSGTFYGGVEGAGSSSCREAAQPLYRSVWPVSAIIVNFKRLVRTQDHRRQLSGLKRLRRSRLSDSSRCSISRYESRSKLSAPRGHQASVASCSCGARAPAWGGISRGVFSPSDERHIAACNETCRPSCLIAPFDASTRAKAGSTGLSRLLVTAVGLMT